MLSHFDVETDTAYCEADFQRAARRAIDWVEATHSVMLIDTPAGGVVIMRGNSFETVMENWAALKAMAERWKQ